MSDVIVLLHDCFSSVTAPSIKTSESVFGMLATGAAVLAKDALL
jgi:hypothetical protein